MQEILGIVASLFYLPAIAYSIWKRRSWIGILAVGIILVILASGLNGFLPPWGTVAFVIVHLILTELEIRRILNARQGANKERTA